MKRFPFLCWAFSLLFLLSIPLFLGGCGQDEEDSVSVSRVGDLVGFQVAVAGISSGESSLSRGFGGDTVRFTQELGDGLVMETTLAPERNPVTRDVGDVFSTKLTDNAKVLMLAYRDNSLYKYQILTIQDSGDGLTGAPFTIWLPVPGEFKLVFYSLNSSTEDINITDYLENGTYTDTAVDPDGDGGVVANGATYGWLISDNPDTPGAPTLKNPSVSGGSAAANGTDAICAMVTASLDASSTTLPAVTFRHLFSRVTWTLNSKDDGKYITGCSAAFGPTAANATVNMGTLVNNQTNLSSLWTNSSPTVYTNKTLIPFADLTGNNSQSVTSDPCVFIPTDATSPSTPPSSTPPLSIYLTSLNINGSEELKDKTVTITGRNTALEPGTSYTMITNLSMKKEVTVRLRGSDDFLTTNADKSSAGGELSAVGRFTSAQTITAGPPNSNFIFSGWYEIPTGSSPLVSRITNSTSGSAPYLSNNGMTLNVTPGSGNRNYIYEARYFVWAGSNIYYDSSSQKLTFDPAGQTAHAMYQGLFFKWGSLVGISPVGASGWSASEGQYVPTGPNATDWDVNNSYSAWGDIPSKSGTGAYAGGYYAVSITDSTTAANYSSGTGDICKYLSKTGAVSGNWRLPTSYEFQLAGGADTDWTTNKTWGNNSFGNTSTSETDGKSELSSKATQYYPNEDASPKITTSFPASGGRGSGGSLGSVGYSGSYWSGSAFSGSAAACRLYFYSGFVSPSYSGTRTYGFSVRCVQE